MSSDSLEGSDSSFTEETDPSSESESSLPGLSSAVGSHSSSADGSHSPEDVSSELDSSVDSMMAPRVSSPPFFVPYFGLCLIASMANDPEFIISINLFEEVV